jgi:hypothetical protein
MKIIFGILASSNENYNDFKNIWIKNIQRFKLTSYKNCIDFYFIYSEKNMDKDGIEIDSSGNFYNYYYKYDESQSLMDSLLYRSISLMEYLSNNNILGDFFIRTNISTFFDLQMLLKWSETIPKTNLFAGTLIGIMNSILTHLSGTNLTLSRDVVEFVILNKQYIINESIINKDTEAVLLGDDSRISSLIIENTDVNMLLIKRLDLIEIRYKDAYYPQCIVIQNAEDLENLFCYRFKTSDRNFDIQSMNDLYDAIHHEDFNIKYYIKKVLSKKYKDIYRQNQEHANLTSTIFRIIRYPEMMDLYHHYKNINFKYPNTML